jgi:stage V sporulation protein G
MASDRAVLDESGRAKLYADIAHPINSQCRETIQQRIIEAYHEEIDRSKQPNYRSTYDDFDVEDHVAVAVDEPMPVPGTAESRKGLPRTDPPHVTAEPPHIQPAGQPQPAQQPRSSNTQSGPHSKSGPHTKPDRTKSNEKSGQSKPSDSFGSGIL